MKTLEHLTIDQLTTITGGFAPRRVANHPVASAHWFSAHPQAEARFAANHPVAGARIDRIQSRRGW